ncbi:Holliday junction resolvase RuvX [Candidatus Saccharibacteria bacterium]|nr:MAG: Holliday junction resolvase RuvX [Candidatus Saccharibacteria bacterium]
MTRTKERLLALDVGERRIGVALADSEIRFPVPIRTIQVDGSEVEQIKSIIREHSIDHLVIGLPRNQQGEETKQSAYVRQFASLLSGIEAALHFQDESLTSVLAEQILRGQKKPYTKEDIDAYAASIILGDYLELHYAK